jgi:hypothetical protein
MEEWRDVIGFEDFYEVSSHGRVRSKYTGKVLSLNKGTHGYLVAHLYNKKRTARTVHSLVMEAFVGLRPDAMQVCHADNDKHNNRLENLRYDTAANNNSDKLKHGTLLRGEEAPVAILTTEQVLTIRELKGKVKQQELADLFGVTFSNISAVQRRKSWKHV